MLKHSGRSLVDSAKVLGGAKKWWGKFNFKHGLSLATKHEVSVRHMLEGWLPPFRCFWSFRSTNHFLCLSRHIIQSKQLSIIWYILTIATVLPAQQNQRTMVKNGQNQSAASAAQIQHSLEAWSLRPAAMNPEAGLAQTLGIPKSPSQSLAVPTGILCPRIHTRKRWIISIQKKSQ